MANSNIAEFDFDAADQLLGTKPATLDQNDIGLFDDKLTDSLKNIMGSGSATGVDTTRSADTSTQNTVPEYLNDFKEVLDKPLQAPQEDTTDYSAKALLEFGQEFAHITSKDSYEDELFVRTEQQAYLGELGNNYKVLLDIAEGRIEDSKLVQHKVKVHVQQQADANFEDYDPAKYDEKVARFFNEDGTLNEQGKKLAESESNAYKQQLKNIQQDAKNEATKELQKLRTTRAAVDTQLKSLKVAGVPINQELADHIKVVVNSGKAREFIEKDDLTADQNAEREIKLALVSEPRIWAEIVKLIGSEGEKYGINVVAKRKFNS